MLDTPFQMLGTSASEPLGTTSRYGPLPRWRITSGIASTPISTTAVANIIGTTSSSASSATVQSAKPVKPCEAAQAPRRDSQPPSKSQACSQPVIGSHNPYAVAAQK